MWVGEGDEREKTRAGERGWLAETECRWQRQRKWQWQWQWQAGGGVRSTYHLIAAKEGARGGRASKVSPFLSNVTVSHVTPWPDAMRRRGPGAPAKQAAIGSWPVLRAESFPFSCLPAAAPRRACAELRCWPGLSSRIRHWTTHHQRHRARHLFGLGPPRAPRPLTPRRPCML